MSEVAPLPTFQILAMQCTCLTSKTSPPTCLGCESSVILDARFLYWQKVIFGRAISPQNSMYAKLLSSLLLDFDII